MADQSKDPTAVSAMFDDVAAAYDRTNTVLSAGNALLWRIATTRAVDPLPGERVLDLAAGTGTSSVSLAVRGAQVTAADISPGMIAEGKRRHGRVPNVEFVLADATALPWEDNYFDAVTISFGLRNVDRPEVALAEMLRVLRPGGRIVVCEFSHPPVPLVHTAYFSYLRRVMPLVARLVSSNPGAYSYLAESIENWPDQRVLASMMRDAGFGDVAYRNLTFGIVALHRGQKPVGSGNR